jgi:hypothetical protein
LTFRPAKGVAVLEPVIAALEWLVVSLVRSIVILAGVTGAFEAWLAVGVAPALRFIDGARGKAAAFGLSV